VSSGKGLTGGAFSFIIYLFLKELFQSFLVMFLKTVKKLRMAANNQWQPQC
jgi:hypothetical protein